MRKPEDDKNPIVMLCYSDFHLPTIPSIPVYSVHLKNDRSILGVSLTKCPSQIYLLFLFYSFAKSMCTEIVKLIDEVLLMPGSRRSLTLTLVLNIMFVVFSNENY